MERVVVSRPIVGLLYMQVCVTKDATNEEILAKANQENPCGTTLGWCEVARENHARATLRPVQCQEDPERLHLMLIC